MKKYILFTILFAAFFLCSCSYSSINSRDNARVIRKEMVKKEYSKFNSAIISGTVINKTKYNYPTLLIAYSTEKKADKIIDYVILKKPGPFMLYLPKGKYKLYSISDFNNNAIFQNTEVSGIYNNLGDITLHSGELKTGITLHIDTTIRNSMRFPKNIWIKDDSSTVTHNSENGQIVKIYDEKFSQQNADTGYWNPSLFMEAFGAGIYFVEKYDPDKIPILFVHGAIGSPQDFVYFLVRLNRDKYQPWFFYYPSGLRLPMISQLLYEKLMDLKKKHRFTKLCLTAYSMGGMVTHSVLTKYNFNDKFIKTHITLATPWSGFDSANAALKYASEKLPNWIDMASQSAFIKRTLRGDLPEYTNYYLFFGKQDKIAEGRVLDDRIFDDASGVYGFNCTHNSILIKKDVFNKYEEILKKEF